VCVLLVCVCVCVCGEFECARVCVCVHIYLETKIILDLFESPFHKGFYTKKTET